MRKFRRVFGISASYDLYSKEILHSALGAPLVPITHPARICSEEKVLKVEKKQLLGAKINGTVKSLASKTLVLLILEDA